MPISHQMLSFENILKISAKAILNKNFEFSEEDYNNIVYSCEKDKVLAIILQSYPPFKFEKIFRNSIKKYEKKVDKRPELYVQHEVFSGELWGAINFLNQYNKKLDWPIFFHYNRRIDAHKKRVIDIFHDLIKKGLLIDVYPSSQEIERLTDNNLKNFEDDFIDFIESYIFHSYIDRIVNVGKILTMSVNYCLSLSTKEMRYDALRILFLSLNEARTTYKDEKHKFIKEVHPNSKGKKRDWTSPEGVATRILNAVRQVKLSFEEYVKKSCSHEEQYVQALIHDFVIKNAYGLIPSQELYAVYIYAILPEGWSWSVLDTSEYFLVVANKEKKEDIIHTISSTYSEESYQNLLRLGKIFLKDSSSDDERARLQALIDEVNALTPSGSTVCHNFFRETNRQTRHPLKSFLRRHYGNEVVTTILSQEKLDHQELSQKLKRIFYNQKKISSLSLFENRYDDKEYVQTRLNNLSNPSIAIKSSSRKKLVLKDECGREYSTDEFLEIHPIQEKFLIAQKIEKLFNMSTSWSTLLNLIFIQKETDLWDICHSYFESGRPPESRMSLTYLQNYITERYRKLIKLGLYQVTNNTKEFFYGYIIDEDLSSILSERIQNDSFWLHKTVVNGRISGEYKQIPCNEAVLIEILEKKLWQSLSSELDKMTFIFLVIENRYDRVLAHPAINFQSFSDKRQLVLLYAAIKLNHLFLAERLVKETKIDILETSASRRLSPISSAIVNRRAEILSLMLKNRSIPKHNKNNLLVVAVDGNYSQVVPVLVENGADLNQAFFDGSFLLTCIKHDHQHNRLELIKYFLENSQKITDHDKLQALMYCLKNKKNYATPLLVKHITNISQENINAILKYAINTKNAELFSIALEKGAEISKMNEYVITTFEQSIKKSSPKILEILVEAEEPSTHNINELLLLAVRLGKPFHAAVLLKKSKNLGQQSLDSILRWAILKDCYTLIKECLQKKFNSNQKDLGMSPLFLAMEKNRPDSVITLVEYSDSLQLNDQYLAVIWAIHVGKTDFGIRWLARITGLRQEAKNLALICAVKNCNIEMSKFLLEIGASFDTKARDNQELLLFPITENFYHKLKSLMTYANEFEKKHINSVLEWAVETDDLFFLTAILNLPLEQRHKQFLLFYSLNKKLSGLLALVIEYGGDVNERDDSLDMTPIEAVINTGGIDEITVIIQSNKYLTQSHKNMLLGWCIKNNHSRLALDLLNRGGDPNIKDEAGDSMLILAIIKNKKDLVIELIVNGANIEEKSATGISPLNLALKLNNYAIASIILLARLIDFIVFLYNFIKEKLSNNSYWSHFLKKESSEHSTQSKMLLADEKGEEPAKKTEDIELEEPPPHRATLR